MGSWLLAVLCCGSVLSDSDPAWLEQVRRIERGLLDLRGTGPREPTRIRLVSEQELRRLRVDRLTADLPPERLTGFESAARMFGLIEAEEDLAGSLLRIAARQDRSMYDPASATLYVRSDRSAGASVEELIALIHELAHAAQDRVDPLASFLVTAGSDDDLRLTRRCVVEGEARLLADRYRREHAGELAAAARRTDPDRSSGEPPAALLRGAPPYVTALLTLPPSVGARFVSQVRADGGREAVAALYREPPLSTEQILHPEKFLDPDLRDDPTAVAAADLGPLLGAGWSGRFANRLGEMQTELFLRWRADPVRAIQASQGWDGDAYRLYEQRDSGALLLQWVAVFDSEIDAGEMIDALRKVMEYRRSNGPGAALVRMTAGRTEVATRDLQGTALSLAERHGRAVIWIDGLAPGMPARSLIDASIP